MSKNIEEIVESVLPLEDGWGCRAYERSKLKQALTEKKLVVPMSLETINDLVFKHFDRFDYGLSMNIYQAQFGGNK